MLYARLNITFYCTHFVTSIVTLQQDLIMFISLQISKLHDN